MTAGRWQGFEAQFREMLREGSSAGASDALLLERFATEGNQAAFEALVLRHGRMVLATCRGLLRHTHDADDAFQATFLILARKARAIRDPELLGGWLHGVARRTAKRAKATADRRRRREGQAAMNNRADQPDESAKRPLAPDETAALHEEVGNLPERYRTAVILCYFEGQTHEEAARRLRRPVGTISARLSRARALLHGRLTRRGLAPSAILAALLAGEATASAIPRILMDDTIRSAAIFAAGRMAEATVASASAVTLAEGVLRAMSLSRWTLTAMALILASGLVTLSYTAAVAAKVSTPPHPVIPPIAAVKKPAQKPAPDQETTLINVRGRALDMDDKPVAGAKISLVSTNGIDAPLGTTTTDAEGRYTFTGIDLPLRKFREDSKPNGTIQVYGTANGFGMAWHGMRFVNVGPRPEDLPVNFAQTGYYEGDEIAVDLTFRPPVPLQGRVTDETGKPIKGAAVEIAGGDYVDLEGRESHKNFREFWAMHTLPRAMTATKTDADGRFRFQGLPRDTFYAVSLQRSGFASRWLFASNADHKVTIPVYPGEAPREIVGNDLALQLVTALDVKVRVVFEDTGKPAPKMRIGAADSPSEGVGSTAETNAQGEATLSLPPGEYSVTIDPPRTDPNYLRTQAHLTVAAKPPDQPQEFKVARGCVVILEAVDATTGEGIRGVTFSQSIAAEPNAVRTVQSTPSFVDHPTTDKNGRLRILAYPGSSTFRVQQVLEGSGYLLTPESRTVDLQVDEPVTVKFELRK